ncbi:MAG: prolyl oligopeptidase family serine peptidase [Pseudomonadales bacterium]|nr:prolyl oligopeptidase family serine peptidase [Pseudomonadales bacterium]
MNPFGSWKSPITGKAITTSVVGLSELKTNQQSIFWLESRPQDNGRNVPVRFLQGGKQDLITDEFSARSRVHEYGGGAYCIGAGNIYIVNSADQNIYKINLEDRSEYTQITDSDDTVRYGDLLWDPHRELIFAVRETHPNQTNDFHEPVNDLVIINPLTRIIQSVAQGHDFYSSAAISPNGDKLAYLAWDHPNMPWDGTQLFISELKKDGTTSNLTLVAGGTEESIFQPTWITKDRLIYVSDISGFWNLYSYDNSGVFCITKDSAEYGLAQWQLGTHSFAPISSRFLVSNRIENNREALVIVDIEQGLVSPLDNNYASYGSLSITNGTIAFIANNGRMFSEIVTLELSKREITTRATAGTLPFSEHYISTPEQICFRNKNHQDVYGNFYIPTNPEEQFENGPEKPPLLVISHGGPTSRSSNSLNLRIQYYTSRGWAVLDVDYGGSTGFGREYRKRLDGNWGNVDVDDCIAGVKYLITEDLIDPNRVAIRGGSAGGYTTLKALVSSNTFSVGASHYGIGDLRALANDTHKFESRYLEGLVGDNLFERSPINYVDEFSCPVIFLQGSEDRIVPANQAELMFEAISRQGIAAAYLLFEKEGHGFRKSENIIRAIEAEYLFFARTLGFQPADDLTKSLNDAKFSKHD